MNDIALTSVAVADQEQPKRVAPPHQNEALLFLGVVRVVDQPSTFIEEGSPGLVEGHAVLRPDFSLLLFPY